MQTLNYLKSRRLWVVRDIMIHGLASDAEFYYLAGETVDSTNRLMFGTGNIGGAAQDILFADLTDFRGNNLPVSIESPRILIRPRSPYPAYLIGEESNSGFRIARDPKAPGPINVDLFIYEMAV
jgi:hypothetical protein